MLTLSEYFNRGIVIDEARAEGLTLKTSRLGPPIVNCKESRRQLGLCGGVVVWLVSRMSISKSSDLNIRRFDATPR
jgi:hypothetical protein